MHASDPDWRPQKTVIDLYEERERTSWYMRMLATLAAFMLMLSFILFPAGFLARMVTDQSLQPPSAFILSLVFFIASYILALATAFFAKSHLFRFDAIYLPMLLSSLLGLTNLAVDQLIYNWVPLNQNVIASLVLAILSVPCWTFFALLEFRKIHLVRKTDGLQQQIPEKARTFTMPETELQRQNLLKLLQSPDSIRPATSEGSSEATYKIHWPALSAAHTRKNTMHSFRGRLHSSRRGSDLSPYSPHQRTYSQGGSANPMTPLCEAPGPTPRIGVELGIPTMIMEESSTLDSDFGNGTGGPSRSRAYFQRGLSTISRVTGERVPSYHSSSSRYTRDLTPTTLDSTPPLPTGANGYPIDKPSTPKSSAASTNDGSQKRSPMDNYTVVEDEAAVRRQVQLSRSNNPFNGA